VADAEPEGVKRPPMALYAVMAILGMVAIAVCVWAVQGRSRVRPIPVPDAHPQRVVPGERNIPMH
jgi:hypothetical protein